VKAGSGIDVTAKVKNSGARSVEEVVQVYLRDDEASVRTPKSSLVAFRRVTLGPGVEKAVRFNVPARAMRLVTESGERIYEPGRFTVFVGGACPDPRAQALGAPKPAQVGFELTK
jgi:beta-glucosidase